MFELHDTFNGIRISRHHTLLATVRAERAHSRAVKRANGSSSYIPTAIRAAGNKPLNETQIELLDEARLLADNQRN